MTRELMADVNNNFQDTYVKLADEATGGETREFGPLIGASLGVPVPIYNRVFVFDPPPQDELAAAVAWLTERDVPFAVTVTEPHVEDVGALSADVGLSRRQESPQTEPGMVLSSLENIPANESDADISMVTDSDELDDFVRIFAEVFHMPYDLVQEVTPAALLTDDTVRLFVGRVDGKAIACGQLVQTGDVAGVYAIGVTEEFRRQGIGKGMTLAVLRVGREAGCQVGALQSSEMAYPLYEKMGFETVVTYHHFEPT